MRHAISLELPGKPTKTIEAVIFDLDGTLVDTMPFHCEAWLQTLKPAGILIDRSDVYDHEGVKGEEFAAFAYRKAYGAPPPAGFCERACQESNQTFKRLFKIDFCKGAIPLLEALRQRGILLGLVTGSLDVQQKFADHDYFLDYFAAIVTGRDVARGKPAPDPFCCCRERLGTAAECCLVVENAPLGIRSARAAGLSCIAVTDGSPLGPEHFQEADMLCAGLEQVQAMLLPEPRKAA